MTTRWTDSCDRYSSGGDLRWYYDTAPADWSIDPTGGRWGGGALTFDGVGTNPLYKRFGTPTPRTSENVVSICFNWKMASPPSATVPFISVWGPEGSPSFSNSDTSGVDCWQIWLQSNGNIEIYLFGRDQVTFNGDVAPFNICDGNWHWVEITLKIGTGDGIRRVDVDGSNYMNIVGQSWRSGHYNTPDGYMNWFGIWNRSQYPDVGYIDDLIIYDSQASTNGDLDASTDVPLGLRRVNTLYPTAAGANTDFLPSSGANYQCVDEPVQNGEADFIESTTLGDTDTYTFGNLPTTPVSVDTVAIHTTARESSTGGESVRAVARSNSVEGVSNTETLEAQYESRVFGIGQDPNTSASWSGAAIDAAEFGIERQ